MTNEKSMALDGTDYETDMVPVRLKGKRRAFLLLPRPLSEDDVSEIIKWLYANVEERETIRFESAHSSDMPASNSSSEGSGNSARSTESRPSNHHEQ